MSAREAAERKLVDDYVEASVRSLEAIAGAPLSQAQRDAVASMCALGFRNRPAALSNPRRNSEVETTLGEVLQWAPNRRRKAEGGESVPAPAVWTGHGTLFRPQDEFHSVMGDMLRKLLGERNVAKEKMFALIREGRRLDDAEVRALDQEQKIWKLLANSYFGALGEKGFHFYDSAMGPAVTFTGQLVIGATLWGFEAFLGGNYWISGPDELAHHVAECALAGGGRDPRDEWGLAEMFASPLSLSEGAEEALFRACAATWDARPACRALVGRMAPAVQWAVALRGNPYAFCKFLRCAELLDVAMSGTIREADEKKMSKPADPENPGKGGHPEGLAALNELWKGMADWVAAPWIPPDLPRRVAVMRRRAVVLADTDSTFLSLGRWVEHLAETYDMSEATDDERLTGLNCMIWLLCCLSAKQMWRLATNLGVQEDRRAILRFKNEFVLRRMVLTDGKKHYVGLLTHQEGATLPGGGKVEVKGLAIKKTNIAKSTGDFFAKSIEARALRDPKLDRAGLVRDTVEIEERVRASMAAGSSEYSSPLVLGRRSEYVNEFAMPVVRGAVAWNCARPDEPIREGERVNAVRIRTGSDAGALRDVAEEWPEGSEERAILERLLATFFGEGAPEELSRHGLNWLCLPKGAAIPTWARGIVDADSAVQANTSVILPVLEAVGVKVLRNPDPAVYSSTIAF